MIWYSKSKIQRFLWCPAMYALESAFKNDSIKPDVTKNGGDAHTLIERFLKTENGKLPGFQDSPESSNAVAWKTYENWMSWFHVERPLVDALKFHTECGLTAKVTKAFGVRGICDLIVERDDRVVIYDWKSGWMPTSEKGYPDEIQSKILGLLGLCTFKKPVEVITFWPNVGTQRTTTFQMHEWVMMSAWIESLHDRITSMKKFVATPGIHCQYCSVGKKCPILKDRKVNPHKISDAAEAEKILGEAFALKGAMSAEIRRLQHWCAVAGPMEYNEKKIGYWENKSKKVTWHGP